jgi:hypothetical protein
VELVFKDCEDDEGESEAAGVVVLKNGDVVGATDCDAANWLFTVNKAFET